jgi:predicted Zn finger-like uncharacterized protein
MYAQCPECHTVFNITEAQLKTRGGLVRCGKCAALFRADRHLLEKLPKSAAATEPDGKKQGIKKTARAGHAPDKGGAPPSARRQKKAPGAESAQKSTRPGRPAIPTVTELLSSGRARRPLPSWLWGGGSMLLLLLLTAHAVYIYRDEVARWPEWRPLMLTFCRALGCEIRPLQDVTLIELLVPTGITPHPRYENILRLRASLVNRAAYNQPYPLMEISLTDSSGNVLARRAFTPRQYLEQSRADVGELVPNVVANALLDVTNPDGKAVGYEIRLVSPP